MNLNLLPDYVVMQVRRLKYQTIFSIACLFVAFSSLLFYWHQCFRYEYVDDYGHAIQNGRLDRVKIVTDEDGTEFQYSDKSDFIFIGGFPRSGTTLMRAMLDAHPDVRCGEETRVIPRILGLRTQWLKNDKERLRLTEAGILGAPLDRAISAFIKEIIVWHGPPARRFCNKDPFTMKSAQYLTDLFPNSKFILMIRDGRAIIHSVISRQVTITGFDLKDPRQCLSKWNDAISLMYQQCYQVGPTRCMPLYYEQLVLNPERWLREVARFLNLTWNDAVLHHDLLIGKEIKLSKTEKSSDQVVKPVYLEALSKWVGKFPDDVIRDMASIAPMLAHLGYDPQANPPDYSKPSSPNVDEILNPPKNKSA